MTTKELRKLNRQDLLEILLAQEEEIARLNTLLKAAEEKANERRIALEKAGSIAEAAIRINGVFEAAEAAAAQYLDSIRKMEEEAKARCAAQ